jgi:hypothetical protein
MNVADMLTGAWGMDFVSSSPFSLLPPLFKIFITFTPNQFKINRHLKNLNGLRQRPDSRNFQNSEMIKNVHSKPKYFNVLGNKKTKWLKQDSQNRLSSHIIEGEEP